VFLSHHHSDHLSGLADLVLTRWLRRDLPALPIVAPNGPCTEFVEHLLDPWEVDIAIRMAHTGRDDRPRIDVHGFEAGPDPVFVWVAPEVIVSAVAVHHEPLTPAVAYRIDTVDGAIVVSGDTRVCDEVLELSRGARVLVHEACRTRRRTRHVLDGHADSAELGALAQQAGVEVLVLTHLHPPVAGPEDRAAFEADVRSGGFDGQVVVGRDLTTVDVRPGG
jgi:ribonuclease Z